MFSYCCCSVAKSFPLFVTPMDCSMPGFPVLHHLPEFAWTHVHGVGDAIQPSHPLLFPSPAAFNLSQHQGFSKSQLFPSGGQSIRASALSPVLPMNIHLYIYIEREEFTLQLGICRMLWLLRFLIRQRDTALKQKRKLQKGNLVSCCTEIITIEGRGLWGCWCEGACIDMSALRVGIVREWISHLTL